MLAIFLLLSRFSAVHVQSAHERHLATQRACGWVLHRYEQPRSNCAPNLQSNFLFVLCFLFCCICLIIVVVWLLVRYAPENKKEKLRHQTLKEGHGDSGKEKRREDDERKLSDSGPST